MPEPDGWKRIAIPAGGLALIGILIWQCIRFCRASSRVGGTGNSAGGIVCALLLVAGIALAVKMVI